MKPWIVLPLVAVAFGVGWVQYGGAGLMLVAGLLVFWLLLHFTRMMAVLRRAAGRPVGHVGSAVMLNAKLKTGVPLLHVLALTRSLGELLTPKDVQPELFRWTDNGESHVTCEFRQGKLVTWKLFRPPVPEVEHGVAATAQPEPPESGAVRPPAP